MKYLGHAIPLALAFGSMLLTACGSTAPARFYTLQSQTSVTAAGAGMGNVIVAIGPFRFAEYLQRQQIVSRRGGTQLDIAEFDRWASPLPALFQRTITSNLSGALQSPTVLEFPTTVPLDSGYQVSGRVSRFDTDSSGVAVLTVQWGIRDASGNVLRSPERASYRSNGSSGDYAARVRAQSDTVAAFSRDIASAILELEAATATSSPPP